MHITDEIRFVLMIIITTIGMTIFMVLFQPIYGAIFILLFVLSMGYIGIHKFEDIFNHFNLVTRIDNNHGEKNQWLKENKIWYVTSPSSDNICFLSRKSAMAFKLRFN